MAIFNSYVKLPEGTRLILCQGSLPSTTPPICLEATDLVLLPADFH